MEEGHATREREREREKKEIVLSCIKVLDKYINQFIHLSLVIS